jgi:phytoene dehydrogenase-like protein
MKESFDTIVVGGGLAGLTCARYLCDHGITCRLFEASDEVGGRVRTDQVDGFLLDRGFQVFLTAYPEAREILDYKRLRLSKFEPGALIRFNDKFQRLTDPWRRPRHLLATAFSPVARLSDKLGIARFRRHTTRGDIDSILTRPQQETIALLRERGFSSTVVERFFRPFLGGVFLDSKLETSSRMCEFVFRMFALGDVTLPAEGMAEIPRQLANELPPEVIKTATPVESIEERTVILHTGERISAGAVVIATEAPAAQKLVGGKFSITGQSVTNLYFASDEPPIREPILVLNGDGTGPINNFCVPSQVASGYAPPGQSLISVTVLGEQADQHRLVEQVRDQLKEWFGPIVTTWRHLRTYSIRYALPSQRPSALEPVEKPTAVKDGLFICGDHCDTGSINGAMASGKRAAQAVLRTLERSSP